jgi:hypothetical protein
LRVHSLKRKKKKRIAELIKGVAMEITLTDEATEYLQEVINTLSDETYHALIRMVDTKGGEITLEDVEAMMYLLENPDTVIEINHET